MTCEDCIHYDICVFHIKGNENEKCSHFKNKTDFVEVVRCEDCKHRGMMECPMFSFEYRERVDDYETIDGTEDDGFCHYGERE